MATKTCWRGAVAALLWTMTAAGPGVAQKQIAARAASFEFGGRLHSQLATSSAEGGKSVDFFTRRARFTIDVTISEFLDGRVQPDFGMGELELKDAYFRMKFDPAFRVSLGQFKRAFDIFELNSSTDDVVVERTGNIDGLNACAGPGGACSLSRFTEKLGYSDRDVGLRVDGSTGTGLSYTATLTNGTGSFGSDENSGKSAALRFSYELTERVSVSANASHHDHAREDGSTGRGTAYGVDLELGAFRSGTHLQVGLIGGENWLLEDPNTGQGPDFVAAQAIVSRFVPLAAGRRLAAVEPMARVSWGDPSRDADEDAGLLVTPGVFVYLTGKNRIGANLDVYSPQTGGTEFSFKLQTYLYY